MGAWEAGILSSDTARDAYDEYRSLILEGIEDSLAERRVIERFETGLDQDDLADVWLGLAAAQLEIGRLSEYVRNTAVGAIDSGSAVKLWDESTDRKRRVSALAKFRAKIASVNLDKQKPKKIRQPFLTWCDWTLGACISYMTSSGKLIIFVVVGYILTNKQKNRTPVLARLDWSGNEIPSPQVVLKTRLVASDNGDLKKYWVEETARSRVPNDRVKVLEIVYPIEKESSDPPYGVCDWRNIDKHLSTEKLD